MTAYTLNGTATVSGPDILSRLEGVRRVRDGWMALCPAHDDKNPSLSIRIGDDGRTLVHCFAGCPDEEVFRAAGMTREDSMARAHGRRKSTGKPTATNVATYDYQAADGTLVYQVVRKDPKGFFQRQPDPAGGWINNLHGVERVLYRLPELLAADPAATVFVVEGEKDVDRLRAAGKIATCNVGGAGNWRDSYSEYLRGRLVAILPDADNPGRVHAAKVAASLLPKAKSIKVVELPDLPEKGDVSDWLEAGHSIAELDALVEASAAFVATDAVDLAVPLGRTEAANARRFGRRHGANVRWCEPWCKWVTWDGRRWSPDVERRFETMAKDLAAEIGDEVMKLIPTVDYAAQRELLRFAHTTNSAKGISATLALARSEPGIPILPDKFDTDHWALNCANGTLDLRTGGLRPHNRGDLLTKLCPVEFDPAATCPNWDRMVQTILGGDAELIAFVQRAVGCSLTGSVAEQMLFLLWGQGANGKSTFLNAILNMLGPDYGMQAPDRLLLAKQHESHPTERADLFGKRLVSSAEVENGRRLNEALVKQLTGGDRVRGRHMREDFWEFEPTHKLWLAVNHKPVIRGTDHGIWRRVKLIPFTVTIAPENQDKDLPAKLKAELPGILAWAVRGCLDWQRHGLGEPEAVRAAVAQYRGEMDVLGTFLAECCVEGKGCTARAGNLYAAYKKWCEVNGEYVASQTAFGTLIAERGIARRKSNGTWYDGLGLVSEQLEQLDQCS